MKRELIKKLENSNEVTSEELNMILEALNRNKKYGLVWEDHPEDVELELKDGTFNIEEIKEKRIEMNPDGRENLLLEGDNLHSLMMMKEAGMKVNIIYIDPPYNTLNEKGFGYNDKRIDGNDEYRHSKWLSFMEKRLKLARELLTDDGVVFVSIDEYEFAQAKLLFDNVFGEENFVENFIWIKNSTKNLSKTTSTNHEYVLCYSRDISVTMETDIFRVPKPGIRKVFKILDESYKEGLSIDETEERLKKFYRENKNLKGISQYWRVSLGKGKNKAAYKAYRLSDISAPNSTGKSAMYDLYHPVTNKICKKPLSGWRFKEDTMKEYIKNGLIEFYDTHERVPQTKRYLDTVTTEVQKSTIKDFKDGKKELALVFGESPFDNPKPTTLIKTLLSSFDKNATILDFFAGSGTTGHAVMELNKEDGGNRRFILCTNNENNICEKVTYERNRRVITGEYAKGPVEPLPNNLSYFKVSITNKNDIGFHQKEKIDTDNKAKMLLLKDELKINVKKEDYLILSNKETKVLMITNTVIDKSIRELNFDDYDKIYTPIITNRDKCFKNIDETKVIYY